MQVHHPSNLAEALGAVSEGALPLAGGTDLMVEVNHGRLRPDRVVALRRVEEMSQWEGGRIGGAVSWRRIERSGPKALAEAARTVGSPQIRNAGTLGGNVATASPAGDGLPFLAAVDASIELASTKGTRRVGWEDFFTGPKQTARRQDELVSAVLVPERVPDRQAFAKIGVRNAMVIAAVNCVVIREDDGTTAVALGAVAPTPMRARRAEEMISAIPRPGQKDLDEFQRLVTEEVRPITDHRSTAEYRRHAAGVLARRLLERCLM